MSTTAIVVSLVSLIMAFLAVLRTALKDGVLGELARAYVELRRHRLDDQFRRHGYDRDGIAGLSIIAAAMSDHKPREKEQPKQLDSKP